MEPRPIQKIAVEEKTIEEASATAAALRRKISNPFSFETSSSILLPTLSAAAASSSSSLPPPPRLSAAASSYENTIFVTIISHSEIPIIRITSSETAERATPKIRKVATTKPIETVTADTKTLNDLPEVMDGSVQVEDLNVVKYSYTAPGICSAGSNDEFYRQLSITMLVAEEINRQEIPFIEKIKQVRKLVDKNKNSFDEGISKNSNMRDTVGFITETLSTKHDRIGSHDRDTAHSLDKTDTISRIGPTTEFFDKKYILEYDAAISDSLNDSKGTLYEFGIFCAYSSDLSDGSKPLFPPISQEEVENYTPDTYPESAIYPFTRPLSSRQFKKFAIYHEYIPGEDNPDNRVVNLSTLLDLLISIGYRNIGIFDFTCSNFKEPNGPDGKYIPHLNSSTRDVKSVADYRHLLISNRTTVGGKRNKRSKKNKISKKNKRSNKKSYNYK
jgi:hypothetical protein